MFIIFIIYIIYIEEYVFLLFYGISIFLINMNLLSAFLLCGLIALFSNSEIFAEEDLKFASVFGDGMVIQQEAEVPVWGTAAPDSAVRVAASWTVKRYKTKADETGKWKVVIPTPKTKKKNHTLEIKCGREEKVLSNILLGEVWICSGQSNMQWKMRGFGVDHFKEDVKKAELPEIRLCQVERAIGISPQDELKAKWMECDPRRVLNFSAVGYFFGSKIYRELDVPIGLISTNWGGSSAEAWMNESVLRESFPEFDETLDSYPELKDKYGAVVRGNNASVEGLSQQSPSILYNGMIKPLIPFAFKGVIWYQGESNTKKPFQYRELFPRLIKSWREEWGQGDFPFYYVQIAPYKYQRLTYNAAFLREAQMQTLSVENTGMVSTMDIGEIDNIHPRKKKPVGERLALLALSRTYGKTFEEDSGPIYKGFKTFGNQMHIEFDHASNGLQSSDGKELKNFTIAGEDKKFLPATAVVKGNIILVMNHTLRKPIAVRYAWRSEDDGNLENKSKLPASSFRTDDWEK